MTYAIHVNDERGDLVDVLWCDSWDCMISILCDMFPTYSDTFGNAGEHDNVSWGAWPGGDETDYNVYCAHCDALMWEGIE